MYHDVVEAGRADESGFVSADANVYKLETAQFAAHLRAIAKLQTEPPRIASDLLRETSPHASWLLTFDDGGVSAHTRIADMLEAQGWRGHFFVTTDYINAPAFLTTQQIRDLHARGHVIGSHSCSHPLRLSHCTPSEMGREWRESLNVLSDILGERVNTASVPGGYYSRDVAVAAAESGCKVLFTSEPITRVHETQGCLIVGRYSVQRHTTPRAVAGLVNGQLAPGLRQALIWNAKKMAKRIGGEYYIKLRVALFGRGALRSGEQKTKSEE
jgi:peptidoglycan/xylan/chitin deacetylase (PgdA/CDA1 family)